MSGLMFKTDDQYAITAQEDRCAPRVKLAIPANLRPSGSKGFQTMVHDLSLAGFCSSAVTRLHPGTVVWLAIPNLETLMAEVVWWNDCQVGCAFHQLLSPVVHDNILARWQVHSSGFRPIM